MRRIALLFPWSWQARERRRQKVATLAWEQHERDAAAARGLLLSQAAEMPPEPRVYYSNSRFPHAPLMTPHQQARGRGGQR